MFSNIDIEINNEIVYNIRNSVTFLVRDSIRKKFFNPLFLTINDNYFKIGNTLRRNRKNRK